MRICVPFYQIRGDNTLESSVISGGIDKFILSLYQFYKRADIIPFYYNDDDRKYRTVSSKLIAFIEHNDIDMLVVNYDTTTLIENVRNIPILWITHNCSGGIGRISQVEMMHRFEQSGGTLAMVSNWQYTGMNKLSNRINGSPLELVGGIIPSSFASGNEKCAENPENDIISIGRCNLSKNPFAAHELASMHGCSSIVHTNTINLNERDSEYKDSNSHWQIPQQTYFHKDHDTVMDDLSNSKIYLSSHKEESWGIVAFEALCRGVPVIQRVGSTNTHATSEIAVNQNQFEFVCGKLTKDDTSDIIKRYKNLSNDHRLEISESIKEKHSKEKWLKRFDSMIDITIDRFMRNSNKTHTFF